MKSPSLLAGLLCAVVTAAVLAQTESPTIFITPTGDGFEVYLA